MISDANQAKHQAANPGAVLDDRSVIGLELSAQPLLLFITAICQPNASNSYIMSYLYFTRTRQLNKESAVSLRELEGNSDSESLEDEYDNIYSKNDDDTDYQYHSSDLPSHFLGMVIFRQTIVLGHSLSVNTNIQK